MKNRIRFAFILAATVLCLLPNVAVPQSGQGGNSQGDQRAAIEGTWIQTITPVGAPTGFTALMSFTAGGVALATGTGDRLPPFAPAPTAPISGLYGSWRRLDNNTYANTLNFFIFDTGGNALHMFQNNITFRLTDYNHLVGTGDGFVCDINGNNCVPQPRPSITISGKRLIAQGAST